MAPMQIFLQTNWNGRVQLLHVDTDTTVNEVYQSAADQWDLHQEDLSLFHAGRQLNRYSDECVCDHGIAYNSTLGMVLLLRGGINPQEQMRLKKANLKPIPGFIKVTHKPDMLGLDDDPNHLRAEMPCGHVIAPSSMTQYAQSFLDRVGRPYRFICPEQGCNSEWDYFLVRHVACLTEDEQKELEAKITENYILKEKGIQQCPGCGVYCQRVDQKNNSVRCQLCSKDSQVYDFCWACRGPWITRGPGNTCGNLSCDGLDPRIRYLRDCPKKDIKWSAAVAVPTVRGCPKCGLLVEHSAMCKHMQCPMCAFEYCHVCLKGRNANGAFICGEYTIPCTTAPIQTTLPGML